MSAVTGWAGTVKAVAWSFLGLRGKHAMERDVQQLKPLQVIAVGLLGVFFSWAPWQPWSIGSCQVDGVEPTIVLTVSFLQSISG